MRNNAEISSAGMRFVQTNVFEAVYGGEANVAVSLANGLNAALSQNCLKSNW